MSIDQTDIVDAIGIDSTTGEVVLTITDHLEWMGNDQSHLLLLQDKINTYLSFVESGEILKEYPDSENRQVLIDVVCKYALSDQAQAFYNQVVEAIEGSGIKLQQRLFCDA